MAEEKELEDITVEDDTETSGEEINDDAGEPAEDIKEEADTQATDEDAQDTEEADEEETGNASPKGKKDKKDEKIEELTDKVKRQMAEFENFRKRSEKEKTRMYDMGAKNILEKMLPVVDNFERGLSGMEESEDPFAQGMQMIYKQLMTTLTDVGVTPIKAVGEEFNPDYHNAVMHVEDENAGENQVVEELQKGYLYHDTVIRHSMVKVAN